MDFESPFYWLIILRGFKTLSDRIVACYYDSLWTDQQLASFLVSLKGVVVTPLLDVVAVDLLGSHLLNDHCFFT